VELLLTENKSTLTALTEVQVRALAKHVPQLSVAPVFGTAGMYCLTPDQFVGCIQIGDLVLEIRPKIPIRSLMFMLAYALDSKHWKNLYGQFQTELTTLDAIATVFGRELTRTLSRGHLRGYMAQRESLPIVRGRVVVSEQVRRWYGRLPPIECAFDEFTEDILENRLLKAALERLRYFRIRNARACAELAHAEAQLEHVANVRFDSSSVPRVTYSRLNERYLRAIELARLILRSSTIETGRQGVSASAFLVDLAGVFEHFVITTLRESPSLAPWTVPQHKERATLDAGARLGLVPDLTFRDRGQLVAVGDVKYKRTPGVGANHPDVYQILAYAVAFDVSDAFLVYPAGDENVRPALHVICNTDKRLHVCALNLDANPSEILTDVDTIATAVRRVRMAAA
jgi:5-methylcytosine-specific restriction enzyme subunit McrC